MFFNLITLENKNLWKISLKQPQAPSQSSESVSWRCRTPRAGGERLLLLFLPFLRGVGWRPRPSLLRLRRRAGLRPESPLLPEDSVSCRRRLPCREPSECCCVFLRSCLRGRQQGDSGGEKGVLENREMPTGHLLNPLMMMMPHPNPATSYPDPGKNQRMMGLHPSWNACPCPSSSPFCVSSFSCSFSPSFSPFWIFCCSQVCREEMKQ